MVLWVQFPVGAGSSRTKDVKNCSGYCLHGTQDEVGTTKHHCLIIFPGTYLILKINIKTFSDGAIFIYDFLIGLVGRAACVARACP